MVVSLMETVMSERPAPAVIRTSGRRLPASDLLRCAVVSTIAFWAIRPSEWIVRWRRTLPYVGMWVASVLYLSWLKMPLLVALLVALLIVVLFDVWASLVLVRFRVDSVWFSRVGPGFASILSSKDRRGGYRLHTWSSWRQHRGVAGPVLSTAIAQLPRPIWIDPATPSLRRLYERMGAVPAGDGSRWLVFR